MKADQGVLGDIAVPSGLSLTGGMKKIVAKSPVLRNDSLAVLLSLFLSLGLLPALWAVLQHLT